MKRSQIRLLIVWSVIALLAARELLGLPVTHKSVQANATTQLHAFSHAMAQSISASLQSVDKLVLASRAILSENRRVINQTALQTALSRHADMVEGLLSISISNAEGQIIYSSEPINDAENIADRAYFHRLRITSALATDDSPVISPAQMAPASGKPALQLARRYTDANGDFAGVVVASIGVEDYFNRLFQNQSPSPSTALALIDDNQRILLRLPYQPERTGQYLAKPRTLESPFTDEASTLYDYAGQDGERRLGALSRLTGFPLSIGVTERYALIFAPWDSAWHKAIIYLLVLAAAGGFLSVLIRREGKNEQALRLNQSVFQHSLEGILITDTQSKIIEANPRLCEMSGYTRDELIGQTPALFRSDRHDAAFHQQIQEALLHRGEWRGDIWNRAKDGSVYAQHASISAVRDTKGHLTHYVGLFSDITEIMNQAEKLEKMAYFDALTGLPNRRLLADRLHLAIAQSTRANQLLAVCYLDLDGFKPINDTWGHAAGDRLLIEAAARLSLAIRSGDTVSRLGGDEFVVLLSNLSSLEECELALERVRAALCEPYRLDEGMATISASIGATVFPIDKADADTLIRHADQAMYTAKQDGRNRFRFFETAGTHPSEARHAALDSVRQAIEQNELRLYYQPKVNMRTGKVIGAEALVRWQHPEHGLLNPGEFLPVVEFVGMQIELGKWVLRAAICQIAEWAAAGHPLSVSINVAAEQLHVAGFTDSLRALLDEFPAARPELVELELLETAALHDLTEVSGVIDCCRDLGVHFAIDDFGTGYSSLTYLKQLHAQTLKIDQSFVRDMLEDPEDLAIVDGVIGLAGVFRRQVVAEGVETLAHGRLLLELGCELAQGYGIARPMPPEKLIAWNAQWTQPDEWRSVSLMPREDLPLITMPIYHQRWYSEFHAAITEEAPTAGNTAEKAFPPLDPLHCEFGLWVNDNGRRRYSHLLAFHELEANHLAAHACAQQIVTLWQTDPALAREQLPELAACRDALIAAVDELRTMALGHL